MATVSTSTVMSCRWDWCRASFPSIDTLDAHVKHEHVWPMKPLRKSEIALMRRMDLQSLHSSPNTDISRGPIPGVSRGKTLPISTWQTHTIAQLLPGQSAAIEMFERMNAHKPSQSLPTSRPLSQSSGSSQEAVEQHLTQEDDVGSQLRPLLARNLRTERVSAEAELRWPTDDESDVVATEESQNLQRFPTRGRYFRSGSLNVPLGSASPASHSSQPIVLQTQAPYSGQD